MDRWIRFSSSRGTSPAPSPSTSIRRPGSAVTVTTHSSQIPSASPMESNPGPMLALLAGTRTRTDDPLAKLTRLATFFSPPARARWPGEGVDRHPSRDDLDPLCVLQRPRRVLEPMTGHRADDAHARRDQTCGMRGERPGDAGGRCRLDEDALPGRQESVCGQDLCIGDGIDPATRLVACLYGLPPRRGVADPDGGGNGLRVVDGVALDDRRRTLGLEPPHPGQLRCGAWLFTAAVVLAVATPVGRDVAGVADREAVDIRCVAQHVDDLEGRRLLALDPRRVDRVDQLDRVGLGQLAGQDQAVVEVTVDL